MSDAIAQTDDLVTVVWADFLGVVTESLRCGGVEAIPREAYAPTFSEDRLGGAAG